ncbi:hypothetical protein DERF_007311 [Dermatophagoides farinae]|uniref:Uncharacterized protein n=1 Tax=Dermatophagoides farinae TaxID=6954 RepID=A0A922HXX0_DERFA|nr:hypothetical protein DERF_007311 [Dermatophagoides farinae]
MACGNPPSVPGAITPPPAVALGSRDVGSPEIPPIKSVGVLVVGSRSKPVIPVSTLGSLVEGSRPRPADAASKPDIPLSTGPLPG